MGNPKDNTGLYRKAIPRTMPMLPKDPRDARLELVVTYRGHKQSRGIELRIPPEDIKALMARMEAFIVQEATYFTNKMNIDRAEAQI